MNESDPKFWEQMYRDKRDAWDLGDVTPPIVFGCGRGHEARAAARAGFETVGIDFAESVRADAERLTPADLAKRVTWRTADIFDLARTDPGAFDLVIEHTSYCAIDPKRRDEWMRVARAVLRPGGTLLGLFYVHGREGGPPYATTREDAKAALDRAHFHIEHAETPSDSIERRRGDEYLVIAKAI
jgi:SAM-dependent methyltransferase